MLNKYSFLAFYSVLVIQATRGSSVSARVRTYSSVVSKPALAYFTEPSRLRLPVLGPIKVVVAASARGHTHYKAHSHISGYQLELISKSGTAVPHGD